MGTEKLKKRRRKAAFTLIELVVVMGLMLLIGGLVTTFILFMNSYSAKNERLAQQSQELALIREETDRWFSYADGADIKILNGKDSTIIAKAGNMYLSCTNEENSCNFEFYYGEGNKKNIVCSFDNKYILKIYAGNSGNLGNSSSILRFTIRLCVSGEVYACEVYYA